MHSLFASCNFGAGFMKLDRCKFILLDSEAAATKEYATKIFTFVGNFAPKEKAGVV